MRLGRWIRFLHNKERGFLKIYAFPMSRGRDGALIDLAFRRKGPLFFGVDLLLLNRWRLDFVLEDFGKE